MQNDDIEQVMQIWLKTNIQTHHYIDESYWKIQYGSVRQMIPESEIYVCEKSGLITGFIGLSGNYIAGLFVASVFPVARHREKTAGLCKEAETGLGFAGLSEEPQRSPILPKRRICHRI